MGSFFPVFTMFSSISEGQGKKDEKGSEETVELLLTVFSFFGASSASRATLPCAAACGGQSDLPPIPPAVTP